MVHTGYDPAFVALSIVIAVFASYAALDLGARVRSRDAGPRWVWGAGAAVAMGGGIWSMHFIGMLAFEMGMPAAYDLGPTLLSLFIAIGSTAAALTWVARRGTDVPSLLVAGPLMGLGVAAMHYTGMAAMRVPGNLAYDPAIVAASVAIAVTAATAALWLTFRRNTPWQKLAAAGVMGLAVAGMHYTGMAAATFTAEEAGAHSAHAAALGVNQQNLALAVAGVTFVVLFLAMVASSFDQRRAQRRLHVSEERFRAAVRAVDGVMWTADAAGNLVEEQPGWETVSGQTFDEYRGGGWSAAIHPEDLAETRRVWGEAVRSGTPYVVEHRVRSPHGSWRHYSVRAVPVRDADGAVREWVGVHTDVTGRHAYETALREARDAAEEHSRAKSRFLANMSHELRTPLSAVIGYSEMLEEEAEDLGQDSLLKDLGKIKSNAQHLLGLINDVLDLSKVEAEKMELYAEDIDVAAFVTDAAGTVDALVAKKGNVLVLDVVGDAGRARTDAVKLRQCLFNLLSNATKFTERGTITLRAGRESDGHGEWLWFTVQDTGIGMSPEQVGRLFERFTQADESTTRNYGGTGLGLALSRAFAQLLGGDITVESVEGEGTRFTLRVPAVAPERAGEAALAAPENQATSNDLVLVIDDEASQRELMTRFLERQRFAVRTAGDGRTGLDLATSLQPRAILLDVMMPEMDGWSVLAALKATPETAGIPVIMVSFVADASLGASLGAVEAVPKPVDWTRIRTILDQFRTADGDVLVVDDDTDMRHRLRTVLERNGWTVREAGDGHEALDEVRRGVPRLVLLDLTMPVMDGFSFLDRLRGLPGCADVPVVVLSARSITAAERDRLSEADRVLRKGEASLQDIATELRKLDNRHADAEEVVLQDELPRR
ncbi:histidine kinase [Methylobacterium variabile]|jgi:PAS domain S-box-containing protein|uniref:histidine kinase n=1 Tax=Methylobacterium variabile TaxID=298794 RepID=A0A0J6SN40_9HYPH|nr:MULTISPECIES: MHYT domain-containing protein [Methylobacterium]KMO35079.1 histidine kinase [Methylobacterium variabile]NGM37393.1 response regulator [Methylobacterium sp. DB0501]UHC20256.1 response regulator [Methylobacterium currus]